MEPGSRNSMTSSFGRDAADVAFLIVYGENELKKQKVAVKRK